MGFAQNLAVLMKHYGLTNYRLAKLGNFSDSTVANWLNGDTIPMPNKKATLCSLFNLTEAELYGDETPRLYDVRPWEKTEASESGKESPKTKKSPAPSAGTEDIMKIYSMLTPDRQKQLRAALADLLKEQLQD